MKIRFGSIKLLCGLLLPLAISLNACKKKDAVTPPVQHRFEISDISPAGGGYGTVITITGLGFSATASDNVVKINNQTLVVNSATTTQIKAVIAKGMGSGSVTVTKEGSTATGPMFTYIKTGTVSTLAGNGEAGFADGDSATAKFSTPGGIAVDVQGNVYVADYDNNRIRKVTPAGLVSTFAGSGVAGNKDGPVNTAEFNGPIAVAIDADNTVYAIEAARVRKISSGVVSTLAGSTTSGYAEGPGASARFESLYGIAVDDQHNVFVSDVTRVRKITTAGVVSTFAGSGTAGYLNGTGAAAQFYSLSGMSIDAANNIYITDQNPAATSIRKITPAAVVTFVTPNFSSSPTAVAVALNGDVYILDDSGVSATYYVERIGIDNKFTFLAGVLGGDGLVNGPGAIAQFNNPFGIAVTKEGTIYIGDTGNNVIRKIILE